MQFQSVVHMSTQKSFDINTIPDGLVAVFVGRLTSQLLDSQYSNMLDQLGEKEPYPLKILYVSDQIEDTEKKLYLYDPNRELINIDPLLAKREQVCESLVILKKQSGNTDTLEFLFSKERPDSEFNWIEYIVQFNTNYNNPDPDLDGLWRIGQQVPKTGEYLCVDCGYIEEFEQGSVFPVCEVCLSGDIDGPTAPDKGYWEFLG